MTLRERAEAMAWKLFSDPKPHEIRTIEIGLLGFRKETLEEACKAVCSGCAQNIPFLRFDELIHSGGFPCQAERIRALGEEKG